MRVMLDIDGCLADFNAAFIRTVNDLWPARLDLNYEPNDWNWSNSGLSAVELEKVYSAIHDDYNFWLNLRAYEKHVHEVAIHRVYHPDDEIFYITARMKTKGLPTMHQTQIWLNSVGIGGLGTAVIVSEGTKVDVINALGLDASLDDKLEAVVEHTDQTKGAFLLDRPWNRQDRQSGIHVVQSVGEFFRAARRQSAAK